MSKDYALRVGSIESILGIIILGFGMLMTLHQPTIVNYFSGMISDISLIELTGVLIGLAGAILTVTGLTTSVSGVIGVKLATERGYLNTVLVPSIQEKVAGTVATQMQSMEQKMESLTVQVNESTQSKKCKFCGTKLTEGTSFCPSCGKSQR